MFVVVFAIGSRWYTKIPPGDNILRRFYGCIWVCISSVIQRTFIVYRYATVSSMASVKEVHLRPLQSVLNAAARLITGKRKFDHIACTMRDDLHWLPVRQVDNVSCSS